MAAILRLFVIALKTLSMLNLAEHKIYPAHKCLNVNNRWHLNILQHLRDLKQETSSFVGISDFMSS